MRVSTAIWVLGGGLAVSAPAFAQDDLLAPLAPAEKPKPKQPKRKHHAKEEPAAANGRLVIRAASHDTTLYVDGQPRGPVSDLPLELPPGDHAVVLKRPGYADFSQRVISKAGQVVEVTASLEPLMGSLTVLANGPADVSVDGRLVGAAPLRDLALGAGPHEVVVHRDGAEDDVARVSVTAGKTSTVNAHLKSLVATSEVPVREPDLRSGPSNAASSPEVVSHAMAEDSAPVYKRWYFWAGAAAVVAAGAATAVVIDRNSQAPGVLSPQQVCGGPCAGTINAP